MKKVSSPSGGGCRDIGESLGTATTPARKKSLPVSHSCGAVTAADLAKNAYREQYGVIVICPDEAQQIAVYEALKSQYSNNKIKVVTT